MTSHAVRSEATIGRILEAAEGLFTSRSYADVTMDDIAAAARVTKGAVYHHFESKEELYLAMMTEDLDRKRRLFERAVGTGNDCRGRLRRLTAAFFGLPKEKRELIQLVRRNANLFRDPARATLVEAYQAALPRIVEEVIREGALPGDPRLLAWQFIATVEVTLTEYAEQKFHGMEERLDYVIGLFFSGVDGMHRRSHGP